MAYTPDNSVNCVPHVVSDYMQEPLSSAERRAQNTYSGVSLNFQIAEQSVSKLSEPGSQCRESIRNKKPSSKQSTAAISEETCSYFDALADSLCALSATYSCKTVRNELD